MATAQLAYAVHSNYTAVHGAPLFSALTVEGFLRSINPSASLSINIYPLPATSEQNKILNSYNVDTVVFFILIAMAMVSAGFITFVVREREVKAKAQQMISGVSVVAYWLSTYISYVKIDLTVTVEL